MDRQDIRIRTASVEDAEELLAIYKPYVEKTAISFEYDVPEVSEFRRRIAHTLEKYPYLVAERDGELLGYAYMGPFVGRAAYDWAAEVSIYVKEDKRKLGVGKCLYQALEAVAKAQNILNLNVCIGYPDQDDEYLTKNSVQYHGHMGYRMVGKFHNCGYKFGRWYHMVWMEKLIGVHVDRPAAVIPFPQLGREVLEKLGVDVQENR